jgi:hypothetical protein
MDTKVCFPLHEETKNKHCEMYEGGLDSFFEDIDEEEIVVVAKQFIDDHDIFYNDA